jgi:hypothetical protein
MIRVVNKVKLKEKKSEISTQEISKNLSGNLKIENSFL